MSAFFITATGTGVGKTVVTSALAWQLKNQGKEVLALKPVISGFEEEDQGSDTAILAASLGLPLDAETVRSISPYRFREPISPNLAAENEGRKIDPERLLDFCDKAMASFETTLIEGIGGTHVPLAKDFLVADWILDMNIPAILVTGSSLGALSHTLVSLDALQGMGIKIRAVVVSQSLDEPMAFTETVKALSNQLPGHDIVALPRIEKTPLYENAPDLTRIIL